MKTLAVFESTKTLLAQLAKPKQQNTNKANKMEDNTDPLNLNIELADVDTSNPSLGVGEHPMTIAKIEVKPWKSDPSKSSLVVSLKLAEESIDTNGNPVPPGLFMFYRLSLQQQEGAFDFRKDLARFTEAVFAERRSLDSGTLREALGKTVLAVVKPASNTTYGETEIKSVKHYAQ